MKQSNLFQAVESNDINRVQELISKGIDINGKKKKDGVTPLYIAVLHGYTDMVQLLLENGANVKYIECCGNKGLSPINVASLLGYFDIVGLLLQYGADKDEEIHNYPVIGQESQYVIYTPLLSAIRGQHPDIVELLMSLGAGHLYKWEDYFSAVETGNIPILLLLFRYGIDPNLINTYSGENALFHANRADIVDFLIEVGVVPNKKTTYNNTPLHIYLRLPNSYDMIRRLIQEGVDVNVSNNLGRTPLMVASLNRKPDLRTIQLLLDSGADVSKRDGGGFTAIDLARRVGNGNVVRLLQTYMDSQNMEQIRMTGRYGSELPIKGRTGRRSSHVLYEEY